MQRILMATTLALTISSAAIAETRVDCDNHVRPATQRAIGGGAGAVGGAILGASACSGFLGAIFFDFGLSYATCLAVVTAAAGTAGTIVADSMASDQMAECRKRASKTQMTLAAN